MTYGTKLTALPPGHARGYESFDGPWHWQKKQRVREAGMHGRQHVQFCFKDRQMVHITELLRELNGEEPGWQPDYPLANREKPHFLEDPEPERLGEMGKPSLGGFHKNSRGFRKQKLLNELLAKSALEPSGSHLSTGTLPTDDLLE